MADTPIVQPVLDPSRLFYRDGHGEAVARNNRPPKAKHEDETSLQAARNYVQQHISEPGYLAVERAPGGFRWVAKVNGMKRWQSDTTFSLASGQFKEGDTVPFKD